MGARAAVAGRRVVPRGACRASGSRRRAGAAPPPRAFFSSGRGKGNAKAGDKDASGATRPALSPEEREARRLRRLPVLDPDLDLKGWDSPGGNLLGLLLGAVLGFSFFKIAFRVLYVAVVIGYIAVQYSVAALILLIAAVYLFPAKNPVGPRRVPKKKQR